MDFAFLTQEVFPLLIAIGAVAIPSLASYHVITTKDDVRAAIGWAGLVWLVPFVGTVLYLLFGINRIRRKAARVRGERRSAILVAARSAGESAREGEVRLSRFPAGAGEAILAQIRTMDRIAGFDLSDGNSIACLETGDAAFETMLQAIREARSSIALATYIFDYDAVGKRFVTALAAAAARGVAVRVLIDGVGELYHFPSSWWKLKQAGVRVQRFNRSWAPWRMAYLNLRNHRKILVVDGETGFTGGMNLRAGHLAGAEPRAAIRDLHFALKGPVVRQLMEVFGEDWAFADGEILEGADWYPASEPDRSGAALARGIPDGPDEDLNKITWAILSALGMARRSVRIISPYFLPDRILISALNQAALRGVEVDILVPERSNLRVVQWASRAQYWQILESGCRIHHVPPPFDHAKLMIVDDAWVLFGSSNWDARSLRLNFELNVECFDGAFARRMAVLFDQRKQASRAISLAEVEQTGILPRLRNGLAWLLSPYL